MIDIQIIVKNLLEKENITKKDVNIAKDKIKDIYKADQYYLKNKSFKNKIEWVNHNKPSKPLKMDLNKYIKTQGKKLGKKDLAIQIVKTFKDENIVSQKSYKIVNLNKNITKNIATLNQHHQHHSHHATDIGQHHSIKTTLNSVINHHHDKEQLSSRLKFHSNKNTEITH